LFALQQQEFFFQNCGPLFLSPHKQYVDIYYLSQEDWTGDEDGENI